MMAACFRAMNRSTPIAFAALLAFGVPLGYAADTSTLPPLPPHKLILTEVGGSADSAVSADGKWLAYSSRRSGNLDIWVANIETGERRQVTHHPGTDNEARWSPDSTKLCFVTMRNGSQDVYVVDLATGVETPVAAENFNEDYPSFSQDGSEICYTGGPRGYREVMVYNIATGKARTLTRGYGYVGSTSFSPDGSKIVFHTYFDNSYISGKADVFIVPSQGGEAVNVTKDRDIWDYKPSWSWDGNWITMSSKRGTPNFNIWIMHPDGTELKQITNVKGPVPLTASGEVSMSNQNPLDQRWSNWTRDGRIGWHQINTQQGMLNAVEVATGKISTLHQSEFAVYDLSMSPDGITLLYEMDGDIYMAEAKADAKPMRVASGVSPRWSRDGQSITFTSGWGSNVGVIKKGQTEPTYIDVRPSHWEGGAGDPLSPDGKSIALIADIGETKSLVIASEEQGTRTLVEGKTSLTNPVWSADGKYLFFGESTPPSISYMITTEPIVKAGG